MIRVLGITKGFVLAFVQHMFLFLDQKLWPLHASNSVRL